LAENPVIPIVFATDDNYVPLLSVAIQSIMENAKQDAEYRMFVLYETVSPENQETLLRQVSAFPAFKLEFIDVTPHFAGVEFQNLEFSRATYYRFMLPSIMGEYPYVIYLDCDLICLADIAEILDFDYSQYVLGAVRDVVRESDLDSHRSCRTLGMENYLDYFNAGVLVVNIKAFLESVELQELFRMSEESYYRFPDQDILNIIFEGRVLLLPVRWNSRHYRWAAIFSEDEQYEYAGTRDNPAILHFNDDKPLDAREEGEEMTERHKAFWDYASRSPFYEALRNRLAENEARARAAETIDPESEDCILLTNKKYEIYLAEPALKKHGVEYKIKHGDPDAKFKIFVANEDVDRALDILMTEL
jgi:lipopolysaccharide biosynthesis glycosyltransferase